MRITKMDPLTKAFLKLSWRGFLARSPRQKKRHWVIGALATMGTTLHLSTLVQVVLHLLQVFSLEFLCLQSKRRNNRRLPTVSVRGLTPQSISHSPLNPSWIPPLFTLSPKNSFQININSGGHSWSLPPRSEPHWGQTHSSRPPSPPGLWCCRTAPGRRCLWSAQWRHVPRWWRHGPTSRRSASHTHRPASLLLGGSPGAVTPGHICGPPIGRQCCAAGRGCEPPPANHGRSGTSVD